ncbi:hypothetical protein IV49_GL001511 [Kandleria vitulina DSM 20405]|jgi:phosphoglycerate dehydrogenase-like enzyme|uniref:D-isomer specific 2-hydroxyacid dehydrogenase NAD-binding domain-containing protein n=1 Tax=Kandleria vitulina DSM 20405 TaxID=1410657 RepID=A0A0R2H3V0_9FIRM|nr:D-2-hydroxyacid dehydrogenase [Kandleria vitulina]KRN47505.1 hypothetical protein IV49_GL001511 [Kandleria vitulina DSM 20405]MEE0989012.1 D-2-hydroxyacid dehydrogenase [Kandleria vitulina]SDM13005.1 Phosphoglycerate dehydrogenase [Kandleria vitulina]SEI88690.1 Phosphoglycerate dehydrogenase [Kandleria vitulina]
MNIYICAEIDDHHVKEIMDSHKEFKMIYKEELTQEDVNNANLIIGNPNMNLDLHSDSLKAIFLNSAGNNQFLNGDYINKNTRLTNASGSYGPVISEHVLGMIIAMNKNFKYYINNHWHQLYTGKELYKSTVLIVGLGDIGLSFAKRVKAFDTHVIGLRKHPSKSPYVDIEDTIDHLDQYLPLADFVLLALPETKETIHLFNEERFSLMKQDSVIANVGRGSAIDEKALIKHIKSHHLFGACLDVCESEPLPDTSPLWDMEQVLITPHVSGGYHWESVQSYYTALVIRNIDHLLKDEPLENEVDLNLGYRTHVIRREE